ncbi:hypothetical protein B0F90DRAFT_1752289 [Multifurca ochricompacta]|uniref:Uncharacterized protein n=1 Tax=Multifurca ochricompacta TaxID=376703 RepID=A0AAD4M0M7_9AGAM|nr:hypothetical protein B0F90DRAFT_1752289 [Multifurca ochricompacta]
MESLNLNALAGSLPTSNLANAEKELLNNFRGVSDSETPPTIGRVMDWVEARLEAVRAREEEELEEDEENASKKDSERRQPPRASSAPAVPPQPPKDQTPMAPSKLSQTIATAPGTSPSAPPSPSVPITRSLPAPAPPSRAAKSRPENSATTTMTSTTTTMTTTTMAAPPAIHPFAMSPESPFTFTAFPPLPSSPGPTETLAIPLPLTVAAGAKRRHAMMVLADDPASVAAGTAGAGSSRRRTRSTRGAHQNQHTQDAMDIEEDGRERKRVARR